MRPRGDSLNGCGPHWLTTPRPELCWQPILLCSAKIRLPLRKLTERLFPTLVVLSYSEIMPDLEVRSQAVIGFEDETQDGMAA